MWSEEATKTLIELWLQETIQLLLENSKTTSETGQAEGDSGGGEPDAHHPFLE